MGLRNFGILLLAAVLEASGDTIIREALRRWATGWKTMGPIILLAGVSVLGAYGIFVNKPSLEFDTTLGLYVAFFAVAGAIFGSIRERRLDLWTAGGVAIIFVGGLVINHGERLRHALEPK